jgi:hypothetical protein
VLTRDFVTTTTLSQKCTILTAKKISITSLPQDMILSAARRSRARAKAAGGDVDMNGKAVNNKEAVDGSGGVGGAPPQDHHLKRPKICREKKM